MAAMGLYLAVEPTKSKGPFVSHQQESPPEKPWPKYTNENVFIQRMSSSRVGGYQEQQARKPLMCTKKKKCHLCQENLVA